MRRLLYLIPLGLFVAMAVYLAIGLRHDPRIVPSALIEKPVPEVALPAIPGGTKPGFAPEDLRGPVSVVNVFASWCIPCRAEHPLITRLAELGVAQVVGFNYKDRPEDALAWLAALGDPYARIGADRDGRAGIEWGVYGVPETFVIDAQGRIRHKHVGPLTPEVLTNQILPIVRALGS